MHRTVHISGMHCRSCELLVERNVHAIPGVRSVRASQKRGTAQIEYDSQEFPFDEVRSAIATAGYAIIDAPGASEKESSVLFSRDPSRYAEALFGVSTVFALAIIIKLSGISSLNFAYGASPSIPIVLLVGLVAGVSTCMALIGGLVLGISAHYATTHPHANAREKFIPHIFFNIGRIGGFALFGGLIGFIGSALPFSAVVIGSLMIAAGVLMSMLGLQLLKVFPILDRVQFAVPPSIGRLFGMQKQSAGTYSHRGALITGALTFFLPCGFTQAMQLYAISTGSFFWGAIIMSAFALGTAPGIIGIGGLISFVRGSFARMFFATVGVAVVVLGFVNVRAGIALTGATFGQSAQPSAGETIPVENGYQVVRMEQYAGGYSPRAFTIKKGIPVRWEVTSTNQYTCASFLTIPSLDVYARLKDGLNVIEFTPMKVGPLRFTCSMGMFSGTFTVVE